MKLRKSTTLLILGWIYLGLSFITSDSDALGIVALICFTFALVYSLEGEEK